MKLQKAYESQENAEDLEKEQVNRDLKIDLLLMKNNQEKLEKQIDTLQNEIATLKNEKATRKYFQG
jgi:hypothetical protein